MAISWLKMVDNPTVCKGKWDLYRFISQIGNNAILRYMPLLSIFMMTSMRGRYDSARIRLVTKFKCKNHCLTILIPTQV